MTVKIVFPHVMKTGGTTLVQAIQRNYHSSEVLYQASTWGELKRLLASDLSKVRFVRGHFGSGILNLFGEHNGFIPITLMRDPVSRVISHYWHLLKAPDRNSDRLVSDNSLTLEQFIEHPDARHLVCNYQTANFSASIGDKDIGVMGQAISALTTCRIDKAKQFLDRCAIVGFTEDMSSFVEALSQVTGLHVVLDDTKQRSYTTNNSINQAVRQRIRSLNEADYELYDYAQGLSVKRRQHRVATQPNTPNDVGEIRWSAGMPFWGSGWLGQSPKEAAPMKLHIWSTQRVAQMEFSVLTGCPLALTVDVTRFVKPLQKKIFKVRANNEVLDLKVLPSALGRAGGIYSAVLPEQEHSRLILEFVVEELLEFNGREGHKGSLRGLALSSLTIAPIVHEAKY